jgi:hypothetical protein
MFLHLAKNQVRKKMKKFIKICAVVMLFGTGYVEAGSGAIDPPGVTRTDVTVSALSIEGE